MAAQFTSEGATLSGVDLELVGSGYRMSLVKRRFATGMPPLCCLTPWSQALSPASASVVGLREAFAVFGKDKWVSGYRENQDGGHRQGGVGRAPVGGVKKEDSHVWAVP